MLSLYQMTLRTKWRFLKTNEDGLVIGVLCKQELCDAFKGMHLSLLEISLMNQAPLMDIKQVYSSDCFHVGLFMNTCRFGSKDGVIQFLLSKHPEMAHTCDFHDSFTMDPDLLPLARAMGKGPSYHSDASILALAKANPCALTCGGYAIRLLFYWKFNVKLTESLFEVVPAYGHLCFDEKSGCHPCYDHQKVASYYRSVISLEFVITMRPLLATISGFTYKLHNKPWNPGAFLECLEKLLANRNLDSLKLLSPFPDNAHSFDCVKFKQLAVKSNITEVDIVVELLFIRKVVLNLTHLQDLTVREVQPNVVNLFDIISPLMLSSAPSELKTITMYFRLGEEVDKAVYQTFASQLRKLDLPVPASISAGGGTIIRSVMEVYDSSNDTNIKMKLRVRVANTIGPNLCMVRVIYIVIY